MQKYDVRVLITLKEGVRDANGQGMLSGLRSIGLAAGVMAVHTGKVIDLEIESIPDEIDQMVTEMCTKLLAHPVIENFTYNLTVHYQEPDRTIKKLPLARGEPDTSNLPVTGLRRMLYQRIASSSRHDDSNSGSAALPL